MTNLFQRFFSLFWRNPSRFSGYLPDSWFVMVISIMLVFATFWIQYFVANLPFWQAVIDKKAYWKLHHVIMDEYHQNNWKSKTVATDLYIENYRNTIDSKNEYLEHWRLNDWYTMTFDKSGEKFYRMQSKKALLEKENHQITLWGGVSLIGFYHFVQQEPYLKLTADKAIYHYREGQLSFPEKVAMMFEGDRLTGRHATINIHKNTLSIERTKAWLKTSFLQPPAFVQQKEH